MRTLPRFGSVTVLLAIVSLLAGAALVLYAGWAEPVRTAAAAQQAGDADAALTAYSRATNRAREWPLLGRLLRSDVGVAAHNELALLYKSGRYDEVIEKAPAAPPEASPHFWAGTALFKKAALETKGDKQLEWLTRAQEEFKLALAAAPDDWDAKFNYELTARLADALRPPGKTGTQRNSATSTLMRLLRPDSDQQQQGRPVKKVG